jgi:hypothetical protein
MENVSPAPKVCVSVGSLHEVPVASLQVIEVATVFLNIVTWPLFAFAPAAVAVTCRFLAVHGNGTGICAETAIVVLHARVELLKGTSAYVVPLPVPTVPSHQPHKMAFWVAKVLSVMFPLASYFGAFPDIGLLALESWRLAAFP